MTGARAGSLALLYSTVLFMSLGQGMVFPTIPLLAESFAVSAGLAVQVVTAHALGRTIILIPAGLLIDRYGAKTAMVAGSALVLIGAFMTAVTPYFVLLCLGQFLAGVGDSVWTMGREVSGVEMGAAAPAGAPVERFHGGQVGGHGHRPGGGRDTCPVGWVQDGVHGLCGRRVGRVRDRGAGPGKTRCGGMWARSPGGERSRTSFPAFALRSWRWS